MKSVSGKHVPQSETLVCLLLVDATAPPLVSWHPFSFKSAAVPSIIHPDHNSILCLFRVLAPVATTVFPESKPSQLTSAWSSKSHSGCQGWISERKTFWERSWTCFALVEVTLVLQPSCCFFWTLKSSCSWGGRRETSRGLELPTRHYNGFSGFSSRSEECCNLSTNH